MNTLILTYPKRCAVYKADACAFAKKYLFDEQSQWDGHLFFQFYKTIIGHYFGEKMTKPFAHMLQIEMLQTTIAGVVEQDHDDHHFCLGKRPIAVIIPLFGLLYGIFCHHCIKKLAKIICHTENFSNFVLGKH
jgi:hypothetical protein